MTLEDTYRRLRRLFPAEWRDQNEEEFIGTLLDAAEPDRESISLPEAVDLIRCAVVLRFRASLAKPAVVGIRESARVAGFVGLALMSAFAVALVIRFWISDISVEFLLTSLVVVVVPGTGVVYTVSSSISGSWRRGLFAAVGCTLGIVPHVLAAMLGLSGIMQAGAAAFEAVRWVGVAYFFAFLPQFLDTPPGLLDPRLIGLGGIFMLMTLAVFVVYAWASAAVRDRVLGAPVVLRWVRRSMGALLIGFAARLAVTDR